MKKHEFIPVFLLFLSIYIIFSNQRVTTSMDIDVLSYASDWVESGYFGSEEKLSAGVAFSPKTKLFYPQEGIGIVAPLALFIITSDLISPESQFIVFVFNQFFSALAVMFIFLTLKLFLNSRRSFFYTAVFALGTPLFVHSKYLLPEPLTLLAITMSLYFLLKFSLKGKEIYFFLSGLTAGYSLLTRPDAPVFAFIFFVLGLYISFTSNRSFFIRRSLIFAAGFSIFAVIFALGNFSRYGSVLETGYTLDRNIVKESVESEMGLVSGKFQEAYSRIEREDTQDDNYTKALKYYRQFQSLQKYLEETDKVISEYGDRNTALFTNGFQNFVYGIYLILFSPNRSIFFLSPFLLILLMTIPGHYRNFRIPFILAGTTISVYLVLYALRAPLSYAGSAAWGVRYLLPVYPILFLSAVFYVRSELSKKPAVKKIFYSLCAVSILFQLVGSAVNYQSVQMPLEHKSKQIYGTEDMTWAHESRKSMMTDFSSSLLLNNIRISLGALTPEQKEYGVQTGPNDWFFLQILKGDGMLIHGKEHLKGTFRMIFLLLVAAAVYSSYLIRKTMFMPGKAK